MELTKEQLKKLLPKNPYIDYWHNALSQLLPDYEINTSQRIAAFEDESGLRAGVQFHPEVLHTENGQAILERWLLRIVALKPSWSTESIIDNEITRIKNEVGSDRVICGLSGVS